MSSGAGPAVTVARNYALSTEQNSGRYIIESEALDSLSVRDVADSNSDNVNIFGDIALDHVNVRYFGPQFPGGSVEVPGTYIGKTSKPDEFILEDEFSNRYLFTNNSYSKGDVIIDIGGTYTPCYCTGTRILTDRGEIAVEGLAIGDIVVTASGVHRSIRWIGHRSLEPARHPNPEGVWPIRVLSGAFGAGLPRRDLWLSPDHAVRVSVLDEVLIPIKHLLNDATIAQVETAEVTYWHVELDSHDILLAEGLPAESFLDTGVRAGFENGAEHMVLHPDFSPLTLDAFCRPLVQEGPIVDAVRLRLLARASKLGWTLASEDNLHAVVDGAVFYPEREGAIARFTIPADATEIRLHSRSFVPERVHVGAGDGRRLGVPVRNLSVVDGAGVTRSLPIGSEALSEGFSFVQNGADWPWRWTTGEAVVPSILWSGTEGGFSLIVELAPEEGILQAWQAPAMATSQDASEASSEAATA